MVFQNILPAIENNGIHFGFLIKVILQAGDGFLIRCCNVQSFTVSFFYIKSYFFYFVEGAIVPRLVNIKRKHCVTWRMLCIMQVSFPRKLTQRMTSGILCNYSVLVGKCR
jgi:hypothetical protein